MTGNFKISVKRAVSHKRRVLAKSVSWKPRKMKAPSVQNARHVGPRLNNVMCIKKLRVQIWGGWKIFSPTPIILHIYYCI